MPPDSVRSVIGPGATIGVFGSGQLGRMLGLAARPMGYRFACFGPEHDSPAGQVADWESVAAYEDADAVRDFVRRVDVVTFEFENVPAHVAAIAESEGVPVRPGGGVLFTSQQRLREKEFLSGSGLPTARFVPVRSVDDLLLALEATGVPAVLKSAAFGYDGKGQARIDRRADAQAAWQAIGAQEAVLEEFMDFSLELSVVAARGTGGEFAHYGVLENAHHRHILDVTVSPARIDAATAADAVALAHSVVELLGVVGVLCVELFLARDGRLLINEIAPRPHNSGHLTIEAATTSQFEQQARAICGLPLGATQLRPAAMANLLGDLWQNGEPDWAAALRVPGVKLHLYGKRQARPGRKMGHLTAVADTAGQAEERVRRARAALTVEEGMHVANRGSSGAAI